MSLKRLLSMTAIFFLLVLVGLLIRNSVNSVSPPDSPGADRAVSPATPVEASPLNGKSEPVMRFETALAALRANDLEYVKLQQDALAGESGFEPHAELLRAAVLLRENNPRAALKILEQTAAHPDTQAPRLTLAGEAFIKIGRQQQALQALLSALQADPEYVDAHRWLGVIYYDIGAMDSAITHLTEVGGLAPGDPRPFRLLGLINKDYERYQEAIDAYQESLRRQANQPQRQSVLLELAQSQLKIQQYEEALRTLAKREPEADSLVVEAECRRNLGQTQRAKENLQQALKLAPDHLAGLTLRGTLALEDNNLQTALQTFEFAKEKHPKDDVVQFKLAQVYLKIGQKERAEKQLKAATVLKEKRLRFSTLNVQAIKRPSDANIRFELGKLAQELDKQELAIMWYQSALAINPNHGEAQKALRMAVPPK